jgi:hypothetical protein
MKLVGLNVVPFSSPFQNYSFDASSVSDVKANLSINSMLKDTAATLEEKMALLDLTSSTMSTKNGDAQIEKQNKENLARGELSFNTFVQYFRS